MTIKIYMQHKTKAQVVQRAILVEMIPSQNV